MYICLQQFELINDDIINNQGLDSDDMPSSFPCIGDIACLFINPIYDVHIPKIYNL